MVKRHNVRITVLKRFSPSEVFKTIPVTPTHSLGPCPILKEEGQDFLVGEDLQMPKGFCNHAWSTLFWHIKILAFGGNLGEWNDFKEKNVSINCCSDGLRPVVFKLERV